MEVKFADSFWGFLKRLERHQTWLYKTYEFFRYNIVYFLKNLWFFRKELWSYRKWDYRYTLMFLKRNLEGLQEGIKNGHEIEYSRDKKVQAIGRAIEILKYHIDDDFIYLAEEELGNVVVDTFFTPENNTLENKKNNKEIYDLANKIEKETLEELFSILIGQQNFSIYSEEDWKNKFDGTGIKGWWD